MIWSLLFSLSSFACVIIPSPNGLDGQVSPYTYDLGTSVTLTAVGCGTINSWEYSDPVTNFAGEKNSVSLTTGSGAFNARRGYYITAYGSSANASIAIWTGKRPEVPVLTASACEIDPDVGLNKVIISNPLADQDPESYSEMTYEWIVDDENLGIDRGTNSDGSTDQDIYLGEGTHSVKARAIKIYGNTPTYPLRYANLTSVYSDPISVTCPEICDSEENCLEPDMNFLGKPIIAPCPDQSCGGQPVNLGSGYLWHQNTDYFIKGRTAGSNLPLTRTYLSDSFLGDFGNWHHNFGMKLTVLRSRNVVWQDENGGRWMFFWVAGDTYKAPKGEKMRLFTENGYFVLEKADLTKIKFSPGGRLVSITDRHGEITSVNYDSDSKIVSVEVPFAGTITFTRDGAGRISTATASRGGLVTNYGYDSDGRLSSVTDFSGNVYEYSYVNNMPGTSAQGLLASIKDPLNRLYKFTYYPDGRAHTQIEPDGAVRSFQYIGQRPVIGGRKKKKVTAATFATIYKEIDGTVTRHVFDENYRTLEVTHPDLSKEYTFWKPAGLIDRVIDELGHSTSFNYDSANNLTSIRRPGIANFTEIAYDPNYRVPTSITPAVGAGTTNTLNGVGDIIETRRSNGTVDLGIVYTRDNFGNLISVDNGRSSYAYTRNADGLLTGVFDLHNPETRTYDNRGRISTRTFASGRAMTYAYDDYDRTIAIEDSHGPDFSNTYDALGRLLTRSMSDGTDIATTSYEWDVNDRLVRETDSLGRITRYGYEKWRTLRTPSSITDPAGRISRFKYDERGRLVKKIDPMGAITSFAYNPRGELISVTDALGQVTSYQYDPAGRKIFESRPSVLAASSTTHDISYEYDDMDRLIKETHYSKSGGDNRIILFAYDSFDRLASKALMRAGNLEDYASFTYENQLDVDSMTSANNIVVNLSFSNEASPPFSVIGYSIEGSESGNPKEFIEDTFTISRDVTGNISGVSGAASGTIFTKGYDPAGRLISFNVKGGALKGATSYDGFGRRQSISFSDGASGAYVHDLLNRVTEINWKEKYKDSVRQQLTYDLAGNVVRMAREHSTYDLSYDPADQLIKSVFKGLQGIPSYNREFGYDGVGNRLADSSQGPGSFVSNFLTQNGTSSFTASPDGFGEVAQEVTGEKVKNYTYRADGKISSFSSGSLNVSYHYDGLDRLVAKTINDGASYTQSFTHLADENRVLLGKSGDGSITTYVDGKGPAERLGEVKNGVGKGYITDHLGSVLNSAVAGPYKMYGLSGELTVTTSVSASSAPVTYGFTGHMVDLESGLNRTEYRMYSPKVGRWLSQEPLGLDGPHQYWYGRNNPLRFKDHSGLEADEDQKREEQLDKELQEDRDDAVRKAKEAAEKKSAWERAKLAREKLKKYPAEFWEKYIQEPFDRFCDSFTSP